MRKFLASLMLLVLFAPFALRADEILVGNGTSDTNAAPFRTTSPYSWVEMLYKSTDIGQACTITSLAYNCVTTYLYGNDDLGGLNADIKIYLAEVTKSELSQNNFTPEEDLTLVYEGTNIALGDDEWETFNFSNPFVYSGNNNLVVVVSKSATTNAQNIRWASGIRAKSVLFDFSDYNPAGAEFPSSESAMGGAGYIYNMLPNMKFGINGGSTPDPTVPAAPANFNATATGQTTIALTWDAVAGATSYNVYNGTTSVATGLTTTSYTVENLTADTEYCYTVTAVNTVGESEASDEDCATTEANNDDEPEEGQCVLYADFESGTLDGWRTIDADGDGRNWKVTTGYGNHVGVDDSKCIYSESWATNALNPDNYIVTTTPFSIVEGSVLEWFVITNYNYYDEHYGVVYSTDGENFTVLWEETMIATEEYLHKTLNLDEIAGQTVYIGFRHFNCTDNDAICIDNVALTLGGNNDDDDDDEEIAEGDTWQNAIDVTSYPFEHTPDFANLNNDYTLPGETQDGADVVYKLTFTEETTFSSSVTGANGKVALYAEDFNGEDGPGADNYYGAENNDDPVDPTVPAAPADFNATATGQTTISLTWNTVENATSYNIYSGTTSVAVGVTTTSYTVENLTADTEYCYYVTAVNAVGESEASDEDCATTDANDDDDDDDPEETGTIYVGNGTSDTNAAPFRTTSPYSWVEMLYKSTDIGQACTITSLAYNCVTTYLYGNDDLGGLNADIKIYLAEVTKSELSQNNFTPEEDLTLVYEGTNIALGDDEWETFNFSNPFVYSGNNNLVVVVSKSATTNAQNIRWASGIRAKSVLFDFSDYNPAGAEFPSSESAMGGAGYIYNMLPNMKFGINGGSTPDPTVPAAPANFNATATGQTTIALTWDAVAGATSYNVYNGTTSVATGLTTTSYTVENLTADTEYCYTVTAVNTVGESEASDEDCATTEAEESGESTTLLFEDFNDNNIDGWRTFQGDSDNYNWTIVSSGGVDGSAFIQSLSYTDEDGDLYQDNYIVTTTQYNITANSTFSFYTCPKSSSYCYDNYSVVISEDGENWETVYSEMFDENSPTTLTQKTIDLSAQAGKLVYIGLRHHGSDGGFCEGINVDNIELTNSCRRAVRNNMENVTVPAGTYYLVASATEAFTVSINVVEEEQELLPVAEVTATENGENIDITWSMESNSREYEFHSYKLFRALGENEPIVLAENLSATTLSFQDMTWSDAEAGDYKWGVAVMYIDNASRDDAELLASETVWSNVINKEAEEEPFFENIYVSPTGWAMWDEMTTSSYEIMLDGETVGSTEKTYYQFDVTNLVEGQEYTATVTGDETYEYTWTYKACDNFAGVTNLSATLEGESAMITWTLPIYEGQEESVVDEFAYNFDNGSLYGWEIIDADGDGKNWENKLGSGVDNTGCVTSSSNGSTTPDNYLATGSKCTITGNSTLTYTICTRSTSSVHSAEHYGIAISTTSNTDATTFTTIFEETIDHGNAQYGSSHGEWFEKSLDLSEYAGQEVYIAFRHFDCTNMLGVYLDNVELSKTTRDEEPEIAQAEVLGVMIYRNGELITEQPVLDVSYVDPDLYYGEYEYSIRVVLGGNDASTYYAMSCGDVVSVNHEFEIVTPYNLSGETTYDEDGQFGVSLRWLAPNCIYDHFNIYRKVNNGSYELIGTTEDSEFFSPITEDGTYRYQVRTFAVINGIEYESAPAGSVEGNGIDYIEVVFVSVNENGVRGLMIYPNPTKGNVNICAENMTRIIVTNALGQVVLDQEVVSDNEVINMAQYEAGIYMVRIVTEDGIKVERITVVK